MVQMSPRSSGPRSRKLLLVLIAVISFLAAIHLLLQYLNLNVYSELNGRVYELSNRVDFDDEASVPTWFSQFLFLAIAASAFTAAYVQKSRGAKRIWSLIGTIGVLLSIDEVGALHELALQTVHLLLFGETGPTILANAWVAFLPFLMIAAGLLFWQMLKHIPLHTIRLFILGGFTLMLGAAGLDIITNAEISNTFYHRGILVGIEESLEMLGASIALYAIVNYLEVNHAERIKRALKQLKS